MTSAFMNEAMPSAMATISSGYSKAMAGMNSSCFTWSCLWVNRSFRRRVRPARPWPPPLAGGAARVAIDGVVRLDVGTRDKQALGVEHVHVPAGANLVRRQVAGGVIVRKLGAVRAGAQRGFAIALDQRGALGGHRRAV